MKERAVNRGSARAITEEEEGVQSGRLGRVGRGGERGRVIP